MHHSDKAIVNHEFVWHPAQAPCCGAYGNPATILIEGITSGSASGSAGFSENIGELLRRLWLMKRPRSSDRGNGVAILSLRRGRGDMRRASLVSPSGRLPQEVYGRVNNLYVPSNQIKC